MKDRIESFVAAAQAKIARGNINAEDFGASAVGPYGANYLR